MSSATDAVSEILRAGCGTSSLRSDVELKYPELICASSRRRSFRIDDDVAMTRNLTCDGAMSEK
jgi:hypothetical protein